MPRKKERKEVEVYESIALRVLRYSVDINASINHEVREKYPYNSEAKDFAFGLAIEFVTVSTFPDDRAGELYRISVIGDERPEFSQTLADYHVKNKVGDYQYRRRRGKYFPLYDIPEGLGPLNKEWGKRSWTGWIWVPPAVVSHMTTLLPHMATEYLDIHEYRIGRARSVLDIRLASEDPAFA